MCVEKLVLLIQEKVHDKKWLPVKISKDGPAISHLFIYFYFFFADDCLLFTEAKNLQAKLVNKVLHSFC